MTMYINDTTNPSISNCTPLHDPNISLKAKGLLAIMLDLPSDFNITLEKLSQYVGEGQDSLRNAI